MAEHDGTNPTRYERLETRPRPLSIYTDSTRWMWRVTRTPNVVLTVLVRALLVLLLPLVWALETVAVVLLLVVLAWFVLQAKLINSTSVADPESTDGG